MLYENKQIRVKGAMLTKDQTLTLYERGETPRSLIERGATNSMGQLAAWKAHETMGTYDELRGATLSREDTLSLYETGETPKSLRERGVRNSINQLAGWQAHVTMGTYENNGQSQIPIQFGVLCLEHGVPEDALVEYLQWGANRVAWAKAHQRQGTYSEELKRFTPQ